MIPAKEAKELANAPKRQLINMWLERFNRAVSASASIGDTSLSYSQIDADIIIPLTYELKTFGYEVDQTGPKSLRISWENS